MSSPEPTGSGPATLEPAPASNARVGHALSLVGCVVVAFSWVTPVYTSFTLLAPQGIPPSLWFWEFLQPLGLVLLTAVIGLWALAAGPRAWTGGAFIGMGLLGALHFVSYLGLGMLGALFELGSAIGILGTGLIIGGGVLSRVEDRVGRARGPGPMVALVGAGLVVAAWFLPTRTAALLRPSGRLFAPEGVPLEMWALLFLEPLTLVLLAVGVAVAALRSTWERMLAGVLVGAGLIEALFFLSFLGDGARGGNVPLGSILGLVGSVVIGTAGALLLRRPTTSVA